MSAKKVLANQYGTSTQPTILDFDQRIALRDALKATGKFTDVRIKMDARRGHLNLTVGGRQATTEQNNVIRVAAMAGFKIDLKPVAASYYESTYRVTTLQNQVAATTAAKPAVERPAKTRTLADAIKTESKPVQAQPAVQTVVYLNYERLGEVSPTVAKQIRQLVEAANKPQTANVLVVDITTSQKVTLTVPYDVAQAVKAQVPSFTHGVWVIKSTDGLTILKQVSTDGLTVVKTYVIG